MKKTTIIAVLIASLLVTFLRIQANLPTPLSNTSKIQAVENTCPPEYDLEQCYRYLEEQKQRLKEEQKQLKEKLNKLNAQQQSLSTKLNATQAEINSTELQIKQIRLEIEQLLLKKQSLNEQALKIEEQINNYSQEIEVIKGKIKGIFALKYSLNSIPWYFYLSKGDLYGLFELIGVYQYYITNNKGKIEYYKFLNSQIKKELQLLDKKRKELAQNEKAIEKKNKELVQKQKELEVKRRNLNVILAQIKQNEEKVKAQMAKLKAVENQVDKALTDVLLQMWASGNLPGNGSTVAKGTIIGYQGHTGCSFGSHLHFAMYKNGRPLNPLSSGYLYTAGGYLKSKKARAPENGALITQWFHEGYALDMVSLTDGLHNGSKYCKNKYSIRCPSYIYNTYWFKQLPTEACFNQTGEGAPVYAVLGGKLYRGVDRYGSKYVLIDHGNGLVSIYYHLK